jgi:hypothetical protein
VARLTVRRALALIAAGLCALGSAVAADGSAPGRQFGHGAASGVRFAGKTSQRRSISFMLDGAAVTHLQYRIVDRCPGGKLLFVHNWGFPALPIKDSKFGGRFVAKPPQKATAIISGTVSGSTVRGTLSDRTRNRKTRKFCSGKARFALTHGRE